MSGAAHGARAPCQPAAPPGVPSLFPAPLPACCYTLTVPQMHTCRYGKLNQDYVLTQTLHDAKQQRQHGTLPLYAAAVLVSPAAAVAGCRARCQASRLRQLRPPVLLLCIPV